VLGKLWLIPERKLRSLNIKKEVAELWYGP
jgi:hypothetical protein